MLSSFAPLLLPVGQLWLFLGPSDQLVRALGGISIGKSELKPPSFHHTHELDTVRQQRWETSIPAQGPFSPSGKLSWATNLGVGLRYQSIAIDPGPARCQLRLDLPSTGLLLATAAPTLKRNGYSSMLMSEETAETKLTCPNSHLPSSGPKLRIYTSTHNLRKGYPG